MGARQIENDSQLERAFQLIVGAEAALTKFDQNDDSSAAIKSSGSRSFSFFRAVNVLNEYFKKSNSRNLDAKSTLVLKQPSLSGHISNMLGDTERSVESRNLEWSLECNFFGLFGPKGPLPSHIDNLIRHHENLRQSDEDESAGCFPDFLNIFNHRLLTLFYESWQMSEPTANHGSENCTFLRALNGIAGNISELTPRVQSLRINHAMTFSGGRPVAESLVRLVTCWLHDVLQTNAEKYKPTTDTEEPFRVRIVENVPVWLQIPTSAVATLQIASCKSHNNSALKHNAIGLYSPQTLEMINGCGIGQGQYLGSVVRDCQSRIAVEIVFSSLSAYQDSLIGGVIYTGLLQILLDYLGREWQVEFHHTLMWRAVPMEGGDESVSLGKDCKLGVQAWLRPSEESLTRDAGMSSSRFWDGSTQKIVMIH